MHSELLPCLKPSEQTLPWNCLELKTDRSTTNSGPASVVGIATGYGLDGPGIESRWWRDFPHLSRPALGPTQPPVQWVLGLSRGKERPGRDADPSPPSSAVVMKEQSYTSTPPVGRTACKPVQGYTLPFFYYQQLLAYTIFNKHHLHSLLTFNVSHHCENQTSWITFHIQCM